MRRGRIGLAIILLALSLSCTGQSISVGTKKPAFTLWGLVDKVNQRNLDFFVGRSFLEEQVLVAVAFDYSWERPDYTFYYSNYIEVDKYGQESYSMGVLARYYVFPGQFKMYVEPAVYYNYLDIYEPVVIPHYYGVYQREISNQEWLLSAHVGLGLVYQIANLELGLHLQWGWLQKLANQREGNPVRVASNLRFRDGEAFYFSPISIRYTFKSGSKKD